MLNVQNLLVLLETKFQGARKDGLEQIARNLSIMFDTEEEAQKAIEKMKAEDVTATIADFRKAADAEISKAIKTNEEGLRAKYDFTEKGSKGKDDKGSGNGKDDKGQQGDLAKMIADAISEANAPLLQRLADIEGNELATVRRESLTKELDNLPSSFKNTILDGFNNRKFASDDEFNQYMEATKTSVANFKKEMADAGLKLAADKPGQGSPGSEGVDAAVAEFVKSRTEEGGNKFVGREI